MSSFFTNIDSYFTRAWIEEKVALHNEYVDRLISVHKEEEYEEWIGEMGDLKDGPAPTIEEWEEEGNYSGAHNAIDVDEVAQSVYCVAIESLFDEFGVTFDFSIEMSEDSGKLDWKQVVDIFEDQSYSAVQDEDTHSLAAILKEHNIPKTVKTQTSYTNIALHEKKTGHDRFFGMPEPED